MWHCHCVLLNFGRFTRSYLLSGEDQPACALCKCLLTVKHFLLECAAFSKICHNYTVSAIKELLETVDMRHIIDFIKDVNFYYCLGFISAAQPWFYNLLSLLRA